MRGAARQSRLRHHFIMSNYYMNKNELNKIFSILKEYRLYSKYYIKLSYFFLFSTCVLLYSRYIISHHITPAPITTILLSLLVLIIIPLGVLYYIIRMSVDIYKIGKNKLDKSRKNNLIWLSDIIYILFFIVANTIQHIVKYI